MTLEVVHVEEPGELPGFVVPEPPKPPEIKLTQDQGRAMLTAGRFLLDPHAKVMILTGYAGSGKTTLVRLLHQAAAILKRETVVLAPTGRAALRVRQATGTCACTIHKWLYTPHQDLQTGDVRFGIRELTDFDMFRGGLVVIDEASMVGREIWGDLLRVVNALEMKILLVGDTFQLEPVEKGQGKDAVFCPLELQVPHRAHLSEVVRQALDSPVLRAATMIRQSNDPFEVSRALQELTPLLGRTPVDVAVEHPEIPILVHRNATRHKLNNDVRARLGRTPGGLDAGEPLLVMRNCHALDRYNGEVVGVTGFVGPVGSIAVKDRRTDCAMTARYVCARIGEDLRATPGDGVATLCLDEVSGATAGKISDFWLDVGSKDAWRRSEIGTPELPQRPPYLSCNYGYALTGHKSQGSEWDAVLVVLESSLNLGELSGRRWAYTAVTRARNKVWWTYA